MAGAIESDLQTSSRSRSGSTRTVSLRTYLLLFVIGTMVPALVVAAILVRRAVADNRTSVENQLIAAAHAEATVVDAELTGTIRALQGLEQSDHLTGDIASFYVQAERLLELQPIWAAITLAATDGRQLLNTSRPFGEPLPTVGDRASFDITVATKQPAIGTLHAGQITGEWGFAVRVPVIRDARVVYVLSAWITTRTFADVLRRQPLVPEEWVRGVLDTRGVLVARSREGERYVGQQGPPSFLRRTAESDAGVYTETALDGAAVHGAFTRAPESRWIVAVAVPARVVEAPFRASMTALGGISLALLGLGIAFGYVISRQIARGISDSAAEAEAIVSGGPTRQRTSRITEVQRLLDALNRSAALLDERQHERDEQVARADAARAAAEAADRAKDEFLAMLGHELRNPLAPALTALHLMKLRAADTATRERDVLERQIRHMARLVDDLLDVSRLRRGAIELRRERFDLSEAVANAAEMTAPLLEEKQHHLSIDVPAGLVVDGDRTRLAQVFANLLSNAAKYTEPKGQIAVRARVDDGMIRIACTDNGVGMPATLVPHVFDLFVQGARSMDRREGGLGLGLAVARSLVTLHGGTIEASSPGVDQGSTFTVRLPLAATAVSPDVPEEVVAERRRGALGRVLLVDDNLDALDMLTVALTTAGAELAGAWSGNQALKMAQEFRPDIAVLDIGLPDMDGFDLARALRADPAGPRLIVALTGYGRKQDMQAARAAGFDAFFVKPVDLPNFLDALERLSRNAVAR
jgi:signal transduction histidine kinase/CheY-like chemotaxis protein